MNTTPDRSIPRNKQAGPDARWARELNDLLEAVAGRVLLTPELAGYLAELPDELPGRKDLQRLLAAVRAAPAEALASPIRLQAHLLDAGTVEDRLLDTLHEAATEIPAPRGSDGQHDPTTLLDAIRRIRTLAEWIRRYELARRAATRLVAEFHDPEAVKAIRAELELLEQEGPPPPRRQPALVRVADVEPEDVEWLWFPYIPLGKLTLLDGDPGTGKSWLTLQLAAAVTRGWPLPGQDGVPTGAREPANVILLAAEDGAGDTIRPRLDRAGADLERVLLLTGSREEPGQPIFLASHLDVLDAACQQVRPALIVVDPLQAFLGADVDLHRANETRPVLAVLARLAERHRCAVLVVRHLSKSPEGRALYRGLGSIDLAAAARSVLLVAPHPDNRKLRVLAHVKSNLVEAGVSLTFAIGPTGFEWVGTENIQADRLLGPPTDPDEKSRLEEAVEFLRQMLADGPVPAREIEQAAKEAGITTMTLRRAKEVLGVRVSREHLPGEGRGKGRWVWAMPDPWETYQGVHSDHLGGTAPVHPDEHLKRLKPKPVMTASDKDVHPASDEHLNQAASRRASLKDVQGAHQGERNGHAHLAGHEQDGRLRVGARVRTPDGAGRLLQLFTDRATVALDGERRVRFYHPGEVIPVD